MFHREGLGFLTFYENGYPALAEVWRLATVDVWGRLGLVAVAGLALHMAWRATGGGGFRYGRGDLLVLAACMSAMAVYVALYLRLPHEAGYLIPIVPFVILLATLTLPRRLALGFALVLIASPFASFGASGIYEGPVITDSAVRQRAVDFARRARAALDRLEPGALVVAGSHQPSILGLADEPIRRDVSVVYFADSGELARRAEDARPIYYLRGMDQYEEAVMGIRLDDYGARELAIE